MQAVRFHEFGAPDVLRVEDVELPTPGAGQVRIRVAATSFNGVDATIRAGAVQGPIPVVLPHTPGIDVAGTVDALGEGVSGLTVGDAVVGLLPMDADGAAAGAHVVAVAGPASSERVRSHGAAEVVDHTTTDVTAAGTGPVDLVLNLAAVSPEQLAALVGLVRDGGALVNTTVWMPAPSDEARGVRGVDLFVRSDAAQLAGLVARVDRGELRIDVAERVPLAGLPALHARAATGALPGKVVVLAGA